jgi:hypothetical protein
MASKDHTMSQPTSQTHATSAKRTREAYEKYSHIVFHTLRQLSCSNAEVEELGLNVFMQYFRNSDSIPDHKVKGWLIMSARREVMSNTAPNGVLRNEQAPATSLLTQFDFKSLLKFHSRGLKHGLV